MALSFIFAILLVFACTAQASEFFSYGCNQDDLHCNITLKLDKLASKIPSAFMDEFLKYERYTNLPDALFADDRGIMEILGIPSKIGPVSVPGWSAANVKISGLLLKIDKAADTATDAVENLVKKVFEGMTLLPRFTFQLKFLACDGSIHVKVFIGDSKTGIQKEWMDWVLRNLLSENEWCIDRWWYYEKATRTWSVSLAVPYSAGRLALEFHLENFAMGMRGVQFKPSSTFKVYFWKTGDNVESIPLVTDLPTIEIGVLDECLQYTSCSTCLSEEAIAKGCGWCQERLACASVEDTQTCPCEGGCGFWKDECPPTEISEQFCLATPSVEGSTVSVTKFAENLHQSSNIWTLAESKAKAKAMDADGDGFITHKEMQAYSSEVSSGENNSVAGEESGASQSAVAALAVIIVVLVLLLIALALFTWRAPLRAQVEKMRSKGNSDDDMTASSGSVTLSNRGSTGFHNTAPVSGHNSISGSKPLPSPGVKRPSVDYGEKKLPPVPKS